MARNAEQLMRSRYSAFCEQNIDYLIATLHPDYRKSDDAHQLRQFIEETRWIGLKVLKHKPLADRAEVEFVAYYEAATGAGSMHQLHELSRFINEHQHWYYLDGDTLPPVKTGRNETCICGSALKFKKCHGRSS